MNNECYKLYKEHQIQRAKEHEIKNRKFRELNLSFYRELRNLELKEKNKNA